MSADTREEIWKLLKFKPNDLVCIVGSGGKSTLLARLAADLARPVEALPGATDVSRVLMATSTKIFAPDAAFYQAFIDPSFAECVIHAGRQGILLPPGIYLAGVHAFASAEGQAAGETGADIGALSGPKLGGKVVFAAQLGRAKAWKPSVPPVAKLEEARSYGFIRRNCSSKAARGKRADGVAAGSVDLESYKIHALPPALLSELATFFDYTLVEADGSRMRPLKGWALHEPVMIPHAEATIGVLPVYPVGRALDEGLVHRMDAFCMVAGISPGEIIRPAHLTRVIGSANGLFAKAVGRRIVFLSQVETDDALRTASDIVGALAPAVLDSLDLVIAGSARLGSGVVLHARA